MMITIHGTHARKAIARLGAVAVGVALIAVIGAAPVAASASATHHVTRGEVMAAFEARTTGGYLNLVRGHLQPAPVRGLQRGRINPFFGGIYCAADWHYLGISLMAPGGHADALAFFRQTSWSMAIDGNPVSPLMVTPVKPFVGPTVRGSWGQSAGALVPPHSLALGDHWLSTTGTSPSGDSDFEVPFTIEDC
jgi:hypothetical protein